MIVIETIEQDRAPRVLFARRNQDRHVMIEIASPATLQSALFCCRVACAAGWPQPGTCAWRELRARSANCLRSSRIRYVDGVRDVYYLYSDTAEFGAK
jgi:hypothetical protein